MAALAGCGRLGFERDLDSGLDASQRDAWGAGLDAGDDADLDARSDAPIDAERPDAPWPACSGDDCFVSIARGCCPA